MELVFAVGSAIRRVFIKEREITFLTAEVGNMPLIVNLDKLEEPETQKKIKKAKMNKQDLKELALLQTEEEIAKDITRDFQKSGWRLFKKIGDR